MADTYSSKGFSVSLGLFVLLLAVYAAAQSPLFSLQEVRLVGQVQQLTPQDVIETAGIEIGTNLLAINLRKTAAAVRTMPIVAEAEVRRSFPAALTVRVVERVPVAYMPAPQGFWMIDAEGVVISRAETASRALPLITFDAGAPLALGDVVREESVLAALRFVDMLPASIVSNLSEIHAGADELVAYTRDRITVDLGLEGDMAQKAEVLQALLEDVARGRLSISHIDLRHPRSPVVQRSR